MKINKVRRDILRPFSAPVINISKPSPDSFLINDIARGLSNVCRFAGQINRHYSVARHSINGARLAALQGHGPRRQLYMLLHDAAEAYIGDLPSPVKALLPKFSTIENRILNVILEKFLGSPRLASLPKWLKAIDDELLDTERGFLYTKDITVATAKTLSDYCAFMNIYNDLSQQIALGDKYARDEKLSD